MWTPNFISLRQFQVTFFVLHFALSVRLFQYYSSMLGVSGKGQAVWFGLVQFTIHQNSSFLIPTIRSCGRFQYIHPILFFVALLLRYPADPILKGGVKTQGMTGQSEQPETSCCGSDVGFPNHPVLSAVFCL